MSQTFSSSRKRARNAKERELFARWTDEGHYDLNEFELWWRDRYQLLMDNGYQLRPRLRPGWTPSWKDTDLNPAFCEDHLRNIFPIITDAIRLSDGLPVLIKKTRKSRNEGLVAQHFSTTERASAAQNHCVAVYDLIQDDIEKEIEFIVMPLLRPFKSPPFESIGDALDFVRQTLEGLEYMHKEGVAHLDCASGNIMMDASSLFPEGFHPVYMDLNREGTSLAKGRRRKGSGPVKYYFIDFGLSCRMDNGEETLALGRDCQDQDVPELSNRIPYRAVPVDIFILGNVYRKELLNIYSNLELLRPLVDAMTRTDPQDRPNAAEAFAQFNLLPLPRWGASLRWRLRRRDESGSQRFFGDAVAFAQEGAIFARTLITAPMSLSRRLARLARIAQS